MFINKREREGGGEREREIGREREREREGERERERDRRRGRTYTFSTYKLSGVSRNSVGNICCNLEVFFFSQFDQNYTQLFDILLLKDFIIVVYFFYSYTFCACIYSDC